MPVVGQVEGLLLVVDAAMATGPSKLLPKGSSLLSDAGEDPGGKEAP